MRQARGLRQEMDRKESERETFGAPSKLAGETFQSLFEQARMQMRVSGRETLMHETESASDCEEAGGRRGCLDLPPGFFTPFACVSLYVTWWSFM